MKLVDTHCHLFMPPLLGGLDGVLARARAAEVRQIVVPAYDLDCWAAVAELAQRPGIHAALGLHPWVADQALQRDALAARLRSVGAVAIGEIGLDFAIDAADRPRQLEVLRLQLELARDLDLPVLLHCRAAFEELLAELDRFGGALRGILHAFSRGPQLAQRFVASGLHLAFGGAVTRPRATRARRSAEAVPPDRLLLETDAPSIGLDGVEPQQVEPAHVATIARSVAELRGLSVEQLAELTTHNAGALLGLR